MDFSMLISEGIIPSVFKGTALTFSATVAGYILCGVIGYILGSLNSALIVSKVRYHDDIRKYGSKNAGMTNMMRTYGKTAAFLTLSGDMLKGVISVFIGWLLMGMHFGGGYIGALLCIIGHVYPVFFKFKGGKGVATSAAAILMLSPKVFLVIMTVFVVTVALSRYLSLGSVLAAAVYPLVTYIATPVETKGFSFIFAFAIALFVIYLHRENIKRLANGTENKFTFKTKK